MDFPSFFPFSANLYLGENKTKQIFTYTENEFLSFFHAKNEITTVMMSEIKFSFLYLTKLCLNAHKEDFIL